jgi:tRNA pseudouridine55 synthase
MTADRLFGLLNVHKPAGLTSRDVVNRVQRIARGTKVGHAGTLDPLATGVLVLGLGPATRLVEYVQQMKKVYRGTFLLGRTSDTEDTQGTVVQLGDPTRPSRQQIEDVLPPLIGTIQQVPPAFSALKVGGRRAYDLARQGQSVELKPRPVRIDDIRLLGYEYPELHLEVACGSGTYIRSLGRDLATALGTGAVMSALERIAIGEFQLDRACRLDDLDKRALMDWLLPPRLAVSQLTTVELDEAQMGRIVHGLAIEDRWQCGGGDVAAVNRSGQLLAILAPRGDGQLKPLKNFPSGRV